MIKIDFMLDINCCIIAIAGKINIIYTHTLTYLNDPRSMNVLSADC